MSDHLSIYTESPAKKIVDSAFKIYNNLGTGLLERVYETCFCYELAQRDIAFVRQQPVKIVFEQLVMENSLRPDILVDDELMIELNARENPHPVEEAQLLSFLTLSRKRLGFFINLTVPLSKNGIKRIIL